MNTVKTKTLAITGALAACLAATHVHAQPKSEAAPHQLRFGIVDGSDLISIEADGQDVRVLLNGKEAPSKRYKHEGSQVQLFDDQGRGVALLDLQGNGGMLHTLPRALHRVRLGVTLTPVGDALAAQLGLEAEKAMQIQQVAEDSPGSKAGLQQYDVITEIDGEPMHENRLREVLAEKKDGDRIELRVVRRGKPQKVEATLEVDKDGSNDLFSNYNLDYAQSFPLLYSTWADQKFELPQTTWSNAWANNMWRPEDLKNKYQTLWQLAQPQANAKQNDVTENQGAHSELTEQLRALENRLDKLEKLLAGLDKKLK